MLPINQIHIAQQQQHQQILVAPHSRYNRSNDIMPQGPRGAPHNHPQQFFNPSMTINNFPNFSSGPSGANGHHQHHKMNRSLVPVAFGSTQFQPMVMNSGLDGHSTHLPIGGHQSPQIHVHHPTFYGKRNFQQLHNVGALGHIQKSMNSTMHGTTGLHPFP